MSIVMVFGALIGGKVFGLLANIKGYILEIKIVFRRDYIQFWAKSDCEVDYISFVEVQFISTNTRDFILQQFTTVILLQRLFANICYPNFRSDRLTILDSFKTF